MLFDEALKQVNTIFTDILDNDEIILTSETSAENVDEWDSLTHIQLIVAIEKHFKLRFKAQEIQNWNNVGEMINSILEKQHASIKSTI